MGRKDRARLYEAHEVEFNYRGDYEVKKLPTEMHARAAAIIERSIILEIPTEYTIYRQTDTTLEYRREICAKHTQSR